MQNKVKTTLNLDNNLVKAIKIVALNKGTTQTKIITEYLKQGLKNEPDTNKKNKSLKDLVGIIEVDEPFNSVEEVRKLRNKE
ncbi:DUF6364 family protein [Methanobrevibacter filiformis]|uniref:Uncharacterized protein n=1 Tax=Methanobrevibacter filiformis TaxID=55758 RepID=A0A166FFD8_9EURY|nr:DUF6364 family protein [Methanobrevibacter filiformis]KZX17619.1 hypothetical protein MBFIL_00290 [Methanobrevibacter filiformis]